MVKASSAFFKSYLTKNLKECLSLIKISGSKLLIGRDNVTKRWVTQSTIVKLYIYWIGPTRWNKEKKRWRSDFAIEKRSEKGRSSYDRITSWRRCSKPLPMAPTVVRSLLHWRRQSQMISQIRRVQILTIMRHIFTS